MTTLTVGAIHAEGRTGYLLAINDGDRSRLVYRADDSEVEVNSKRLPPGRHTTHFAIARALGEASCLREEMRIGYIKKDKVEARHIGRIVPRDDGKAILCADLDKNAPRCFLLAGIAWVEREET